MHPHTPPYATIPLFQHTRRTYLACLRCRKRKIRCLSVDENTPCERCSRRGLDRTQGPRKVMGRPATKTAHQHQSIRENGLNINLNSLRAGTAVPPTMTKSIHQVAQGRYTADTILYLNYNFLSAAPVLYTPSVARHQLIKEHALKLYHFSLAALVLDTCIVVSMQSVLRRQAIKEDILKLKQKFLDSTSGEQKNRRHRSRSPGGVTVRVWCTNWRNGYLKSGSAEFYGVRSKCISYSSGNPAFKTQREVEHFEALPPGPLRGAEETNTVTPIKLTLSFDSDSLLASNSRARPCKILTSVSSSPWLYPVNSFLKSALRNAEKLKLCGLKLELWWQCH
ncbi:hypothetical protein DFH09DRAFT_1289684 [Mycena vulgaris]|nr:hypothetical protein DFH09DRAFT_1289684 [Mycena vulgaris]